MKIAAYQFGITGNIDFNFKSIKNAINKAVEKEVKLLIFPECALTGYPPRDIKCSADVNFSNLNIVYKQLQDDSDKNDICIIVGSIIQEGDKYFNCAIVFRPHQEKLLYHKRAL